MVLQNDILAPQSCSKTNKIILETLHIIIYYWKNIHMMIPELMFTIDQIWAPYATGITSELIQIEILIHYFI